MDQSVKQISVRSPASSLWRLLKDLFIAHQLLYPGVQISTLREVFDFVACADPSYQILWNIESKINPQYPNRTAGVDDFVQKQLEIFISSPYYRSITVSVALSILAGSLTSLPVSKFWLANSSSNEGFLFPFRSLCFLTGRWRIWTIKFQFLLS